MTDKRDCLAVYECKECLDGPCRAKVNTGICPSRCLNRHGYTEWFMVGTCANDVRDEIKRFAENMENVLRQHDPDKGDSWEWMNICELWGLLENKSDDVSELILPADTDSDRENLIDLANYSMMLWHRLRSTVHKVGED